MNDHIKNLLNEFTECEPTLNAMKEFLLSYLHKLICVENGLFVTGIEGRVKNYDSLEKKLELKGHKYKTIGDITDLVGVRVITFYKDQVDFIASLIEKNFDIDYENSVDKRKMYEVDRFGYMSLHYICKIPKSLYNYAAYPKLNDIRFEIQMRTTLQHVWATIFHDTGYKSDVEVPREYIRRLARLEGMLEIADDEFLNIRNEIDSYRNKIRSLVKNGEFKDISFNIDSYESYLSIKPYMSLIEKIASVTGAEVEFVPFIKFYDTFVDLGIQSLSEIEQMRIENSEDAYKLSLIQLGGTDIDIISSTVALRNILIMYILKKGGTREDLKKLFASMFGNSMRMSDASIDRIIEQAKGIIMI
ncbi:MAG: hypothetical protein J6O09_00255 [Lachnospiraceae bacterium]|nr:hypothetical protein [Lachnospiraceae bacterium]